jgi:predicted transcriptional regulator
MTALKAHVENGRVVLDEAMELPDGTMLRVVAVADGDDLDDAERADLHAAIREGLEDMKAGRTYAAADVIAELRSRS